MFFISLYILGILGIPQTIVYFVSLSVLVNPSKVHATYMHQKVLKVMLVSVQSPIGGKYKLTPTKWRSFAENFGAKFKMNWTKIDQVMCHHLPSGLNGLKPQP